MSRLSQVLLFDSESRGRDILSYGLEGESIATRQPESAAEALAALAADPHPQVLVVVLRATEDESWSLLRQIAADEALRNFPRLALAAAAELPGELGQLPGDVHFLPLPAYVRDVITACRMLAAGGSAEAQLVGTLSEYGLLFIVRTMVGLGRSGIVQVERAHRKGELRFDGGKLVSAEVGSLSGEPALHQLLLWEQASLEIRFGPVAARGQTFPQGDDLLEDTERFLRDFAHATKNIGQAQSLFIQDAEKIASSVDGIPAEVLPVMKLFDGQRNLGDVLEDSPFRVFDTLKVVSRLIEMGIVRRKAIEKPSSGLPAPRAAARPAASLPAAPAPLPPAAPAPLPRSNGAATDSRHRRRSRRRTGEVPIQPEAFSPEKVVDSVRAELRGELHGELRSERNQPISPNSETMPKVLVDLGPVLDVEPPPPPIPDGIAPEAVARAPEPPPPVALPPVARVPLAPVETVAPPPAESVPPPPIAPEPPTSVPAEPPADTAGVPEQRLAGIHSAEFDTSGQAPPAPELLATPGSGPSIMLDPNLVAEMDAFELANTAATPPPTVTAPPPAATPKAPPKPAAAPAAVVSFVKGAGHPPPAGSHTLNSAPTVPISPVAAGAHAAAGSPPAAPAPANPPAAAGPVRSPTPVPAGEPPAGRRASGEFNALEADFFARESDLYHHEPAESFDDLDPVTRERRRRS